MKCLTIVITIFLVCLWRSILFLYRRPKHCHWDFALIVIVKITLFPLLFFAVWSTRRSPTCFGIIWSVFNSFCILNNSRNKLEDTVNPLLSFPFLISPTPPQVDRERNNYPHLSPCLPISSLFLLPYYFSQRNC